ncbi:MAG: ProQ/FINO family protein [Proteobacteria bacterium]|nr:ProQ/FINO family protein [Pseudomonadota bacterium]
MGKQSFYRNRQQAYEWLKTTFPASFGCDIPLKLGIHRDVLAYQGQNKPANVHLRRAITIHVSRVAYLKHLKVGAERVDLDGKGCGQLICTDEALKAKQKRQALHEKYTQKKALASQNHSDQQDIEEEKVSETEKTKRPILSLKKKSQRKTG